MASAPTYEQIAWTQVGAGTASITFSSIAASWTDLRLVFSVSSVSSTIGPITVQFNSDAGTNYSLRYLGGAGSSVATSSSQSQTYFSLQYLGESTTQPALFTLDVLQYANTGVYKTLLSSEAADFNGSGSTSARVGLWLSTAAINTITLTKVSAGVFATATTVALYGIKAA